MNSYTMLSFDVEEFDMPLEYDQQISPELQMETGRLGLEALIPIWEKYNTPCTLFTTANYAQHFPETIRELAKKHEIASHTFYHSTFETADLEKSRIVLEEMAGTHVTGLRMPRMKKVAMEDVAKAGYEYDSSINPTIIPGRYNNFHLPRTVYTENGVTRIPASVSPVIRLPLFWLAFKNYPYKLFLQLCLQTLKKDGYICLYFHPWEFTDLANFKLPGYAKKPDGIVLQQRLERLIKDLSERTRFITIRDFLSSGK
jgi:peptidoglycan/xylan/chitin deacetylase (PgdA/CDA1 family)